MEASASKPLPIGHEGETLSGVEKDHFRLNFRTVFAARIASGFRGNAVVYFFAVDWHPGWRPQAKADTIAVDPEDLHLDVVTHHDSLVNFAA
jgi:hypothetical protein